MIDSRIETFLTLCNVMNYRKTAEILNMTQPAVTQHIHYLEERYSCKLFIYDKRILKMTHEAEILKRYAENILYQEKKMITELNSSDVINFSVGVTKTIGEYVIADHVASFLSNPDNRIAITVDNTENLLSLLTAGEIDFALIEGIFDRSRFASKKYRNEPFVGLCGTGHPFAGRTVTLDEIWNENLILREEGSGTRDILSQLLSAGNHSFNEFGQITTISSFGLITNLLEKNNCITFAYRAVGEHNNAIAEFYIDGWDIAREFNYIYLDTPYSKQAVEYFEGYKTE